MDGVRFAAGNASAKPAKGPPGAQTCSPAARTLAGSATRAGPSFDGLHGLRGSTSSLRSRFTARRNQAPGEFRRRPTAIALELRLVIGFGRRGLSESWGLHSAAQHVVCLSCDAKQNHGTAAKGPSGAQACSAAARKFAPPCTMTSQSSRYLSPVLWHHPHLLTHITRHLLVSSALAPFLSPGPVVRWVTDCSQH